MSTEKKQPIDIIFYFHKIHILGKLNNALTMDMWLYGKIQQMQRNDKCEIRNCGNSLPLYTDEWSRQCIVLFLGKRWFHRCSIVLLIYIENEMYVNILPEYTLHKVRNCSLFRSVITLVPTIVSGTNQIFRMNIIFISNVILKKQMDWYISPRCGGKMWR